ncbi:MAG: glycosyltransferase family 4 protein [Patescibacteria group bacterium]|nr:glycosyltransferase family 4 protein [Patescibacteria group bacterium]
MKLIIISQKVDINDDNLGFFHYWLEKFAGKLEKVYVVCLSKGKHNLPENVLVYSLGKEKSYSKLRQLFRLQKFLFKNLKEVDGVFVHMCPIYAITSFPLVKIFRKKMILWYLHKSVNWKLKLAEKLVDKILTASKESCRLKSRKKIEIVGHGVDVEVFKPSYNIDDMDLDATAENRKFKILSAGRIAPVKDQETLIRAADILVNQKNIKNIKVQILGTPLENHEKEYFEQLRNLIQEKKLEEYIKFSGSIPYNKMPEYYQDSDLVINLSHTGSIDKVVLEAMASGCLILTCNEAFKSMLSNQYLFQKKNPQELAEKIINLKSAKKDRKLREIVVENYNLNVLIKKIIQKFNV